MDGWTWFFDLAVDNLALALLLGLLVIAWRFLRWFGDKIVLPLAGPDGKIAKWLDAQAAQHTATIEANRSLTTCMGDAVNAIRGIRGSVEHTEQTVIQEWAKGEAIARAGIERLGVLEGRVAVICRAKVHVCRALSHVVDDAGLKGDLTQAILLLEKALDD